MHFDHNISVANVKEWNLHGMRFKTSFTQLLSSAMTEILCVDLIALDQMPTPKNLESNI